ncbi:MAG TPA: hypothetical protein VGQ27_02350 [Steroidobacteraceae bacterium]|nr:hypothetical protein [Steroidobacteraceae bacterium]
MSRTRWIVVTTLALALGAIAWRSLQVRVLPRDTAIFPETERPRPRALVNPVAAPGVDGKSAPAATPGDYATGYHNANDLLAYLDSLASAAERGDTNAMYWMFRASRRCVRDYAIYFGAGAHERTLERALVMNAHTLDERSTRELYTKCANFRAASDNRYRDWRTLLKRASDAGNPVAEATQAAATFSNLNSWPDATTSQQMRDDMVALARDALRSRDPAVLAEMSQVSGARRRAGGAGDPGEADDASAVWLLAACQRGYDCSMDNEEYRAICVMDRACQPSDTLVDFYRRYNPERFDALELRATELNAQLDAGNFDDIPATLLISAGTATSTATPPR